MRTTTYQTILLRFLAYLDQQIAELESQLLQPFDGDERRQAMELVTELHDRRLVVESRLKSFRHEVR